MSEPPWFGMVELVRPFRRVGETVLDTVERMVLEDAMRRSGGVQSVAARDLCMSRRVLNSRLKNFGMLRRDAARKAQAGDAA